MSDTASPKSPRLTSICNLGEDSSPVERAEPVDLDDKENIRPVATAAETTTTTEIPTSTSSATHKVKPSSCLFVANLRSSRSDDDLYRSVASHFKEFGKLASVKVLRDLENRPYAFVQYTNDDDCRCAIELNHNSFLDGRKLRCEAARVNRTLFVSGVHAMTLSEIEQEISEYGEIELIIASTEDGQLISDPRGRDHHGHNWFVKFSYREDAIRAFANMSEDPEYMVEWAQNIDDSDVYVPSIDKLSIFVALLSKEVTEENLRSHFSEHGEIESITIRTKLNSRFAFITYHDEKSAASAVASENHSMFMDKTVHVQYRRNAPRALPRIILSPRTPIALAPPPISIRRPLAPTGKNSRSSGPIFYYDKQPDGSRTTTASESNYNRTAAPYEHPRKALAARDYNAGVPAGALQRGYHSKRLNERSPGNRHPGGPGSNFLGNGARR